MFVIFVLSFVLFPAIAATSELQHLQDEIVAIKNVVLRLKEELLEKDETIQRMGLDISALKLVKTSCDCSGLADIKLQLANTTLQCSKLEKQVSYLTNLSSIVHNLSNQMSHTITVLSALHPTPGSRECVDHPTICPVYASIVDFCGPKSYYVTVAHLYCRKLCNLC